jgi:site-specific recombinase XerD
MGHHGARVLIAGPLAVFADGFRGELERLGYSVWTIEAQLQLMAQLSRWLDGVGVGVEGLTAARAEEFLAYRRACGRAHRFSTRALVPLLGFLRGLGVAPPPAPAAVVTAVDGLVCEFEQYLLRDRGLVARTLEDYRRVAQSFLSDRFGDGDLRCERLTAADVTGFMLAESARRSAGSLGNTITGLRALLRFLYLRGCTPLPLAAAVPAVARRRTDAAPILSGAEARRLLESCDRGRAIGRRDHAILTVLVRLGLRASEVAALALEDVDWRGGELVVAGKGPRRDRLPLPVDVGAALADYLQHGRPTVECRSVFVHARAPYCALGRCGVSHVVRYACQRAGVAEVRAHRLRHGAATQMHREGAGLIEIGQVLRHRHTATTTIYARTDPRALAELARPWPTAGGAS